MSLTGCIAHNRHIPPPPLRIDMMAKTGGGGRGFEPKVGGSIPRPGLWAPYLAWDISQHDALHSSVVAHEVCFQRGFIDHLKKCYVGLGWTQLLEL